MTIKLCFLSWTIQLKTFHLILKQFKIFRTFQRVWSSHGKTEFFFLYIRTLAERKVNVKPKYPSLGSRLSEGPDVMLSLSTSWAVVKIWCLNKKNVLCKLSSILPTLVQCVELFLYDYKLVPPIRTDKIFLSSDLTHLTGTSSSEVSTWVDL